MLTVACRTASLTLCSTPSDQSLRPRVYSVRLQGRSTGCKHDAGRYLAWRRDGILHVVLAANRQDRAVHGFRDLVAASALEFALLGTTVRTEKAICLGRRQTSAFADHQQRM